MDARELKPRLITLERLAAATLGGLLALGLWQAYGVLLFSRGSFDVG